MEQQDSDNNNSLSPLPLPYDSDEIDHDDADGIQQPLDPRPLTNNNGDEEDEEDEDEGDFEEEEEEEEEEDDDDVPPMDSIVVQSRSISGSSGNNDDPSSLPPLEHEDMSMHSSPTDEDDDPEGGDVDDDPEDDEVMVYDDEERIVAADEEEEEDEAEEGDEYEATSELLLAATSNTTLLRPQPGDYVVPTKEPDEQDENSTRDVSEKSPSVNGTADSTKAPLGSRFPRGRKARRGMPSYLQRRKLSTGRSRTPQAPSPIIPPRSTSPWPEIQDSSIRDAEEEPDSKRRRITRQLQQQITQQHLPPPLQDASSLTPNGTKESTPQPGTAATRGTRRQAASMAGLGAGGGGGGDDDTGLTPEERLKRSKRVKISPRKEKQQPSRQRSPPHSLSGAMAREDASGTATPRLIINMKVSEKEDSDPTKYNEENCGACGGPGRFLCCEGCPKSFHFTCLEPPIDENDLPEDSWYCNSCRALRDPPRRSDNRLFEKLIDKMARMNPVQFSLPKSIRTYFEGVTTGEDGEYQETCEVKTMRANARGFVEEPDPFRLRDKQGRPVFCFRCGETASANRRILSCDHCTQHWHMDCLDPPMASLPPLTKKWMCPLHASHAYRRMRRPKHKIKLVDVSLPRGFRNWGDIEIENDESSDEEREGHRILEDGFESDFSIDGTTYRLPEKGIKLDFLEKIHMERLRPKSLDMLSDQAVAISGSGSKPRLRLEDVLRPTQSTKQDSLRVLLQAALGDSPSSTGSSPGSSKENHSREANGENQIIVEKELKELRAIKKLMELKGYDALMKFLEAS